MKKKLNDAAFASEQEHLSAEFPYIQRMDGKEAVTLFDMKGTQHMVGITFKVRPDYWPQQQVREGTPPNTRKYLTQKFKREHGKIRGYHLSVTHAVFAEPDRGPGEYLGRSGDSNLFQRELPEEMALASFLKAHACDLPPSVTDMLNKLYITPNLLLEAGKAKRCVSPTPNQADGMDERHYLHSGIERALREAAGKQPVRWHEKLQEDMPSPEEGLDR